MKSWKHFTFMSIIAIIALVFAFTACDSGDDSDDNSGSSGGGGSGSSGGTGGGAGSTREKAISVTVGYSSSHTISSSGQHWFKFTGTGDPVIFETEGNVVDTYIWVFEGNSSGTGIHDENSGEGSNALCSFNSTLGTMYFIKIEPRSGTSGTYTLVVTAPTFNIRTNPIPVTVGYSSSHTIISSGQHWFSLQGTGNSVVFETQSNVVDTSINLYIEDSTSSILTDNTRIGFSTVLGTMYFIRVEPLSGMSGTKNGTYTFSVCNGIGDGSSQSYAIPVMVGYSSTHTFNLSSDQHWFSFLGTGSTVVFETEGNVVDTFIAVFGTGVPLFNDDDNSGEGSNALYDLNTTLGTTYFISITARSGTSGTYTFVVR